MGIWTIVIIILVIITVLAFASAVCVAYDAWRKEKRINWEILLEGLFFIPLCLFLAVLWPIHKLRMYIKEKKREKQFEESKK